MLLAVAAFMFFTAAGRSPLWDDDETRFASVAREMASSGNWVVPRFNGEVSDKPPLLFWAVAASFQLFGESARSARLPSIVFALVSLAAIWSIGRRLHGRCVAWWATVALGTSLLFFAESTLATTDSMLLAMVGVSMWLGTGQWWQGGTRSFRHARFGAVRALLLGVAGGLGILTKGPAGLILPVICLWIFSWWMLWQRGHRWRGGASSAWRALSGLRPLLILGGACAMALPWHVLIFRESGWDWFRIFYLEHYAGRVPWLGTWAGVSMQPVEGHGGFPLFQVAALLGGLFPWSSFLPLSVWRSARAAVGSGDPASRFVVTWLFVWLVVVSFSATQLPHYIFPAFPAAALMVAVLLVRAVREPASLVDGWWYAACGGLATGALTLVCAAIVAASIGLVPWRMELLAGGVVTSLIAIGVAVAIRAGKRTAAAAVMAGGALALAAAVSIVTLPAIGRANPLPDLIGAADDSVGGDARLAGYRFGLPGLAWHSGRLFTVCRSGDDVGRFLEGSPRAVVFMPAARWDELEGQFKDRAVVLGSCRLLMRKEEVVIIGRSAGSVPQR